MIATPRYAFFLLIATLLTVVLMICPAAQTAETSSATASTASVEKLDRDITLLQKILKRRPDAELYYRLGDLYIQKGRQTGDISYFQLSESALRQSLTLEPRLAQAHRHLAFVLYSLHDFTGAAGEAKSAIKLDSSDSYAYGVLGDAQLETGRYESAAGSYSQMVSIKGDLYSYSRLSGLETIRNHNARAITDLKRAIADGLAASEPPEGIAWAQERLAEDYFLLGDMPNAEAAAQAALQTYPNYHRALAMLGQVKAAQGRLEESASLYKRAIAIIPLPEYASVLSDVYQRMGRNEDAQNMRDLVAFIAHLNALNRVVYNRTLVDYYADHDLHHRDAVAMAAAEYRIRKDIYGADARAWTLYRNGDAAHALAYINSALRFHTTDARLYFHAGMIKLELGHKQAARADLEQALKINPHFQPLLDEVAGQTLVALGGKPPSEYVQANGVTR